MEPGSVVWVVLDPTEGREQQGRRPAVVVSSHDHLDAATTLVTVVPVTGRDRQWPNHVGLVGPTGLRTEGFAMTEQVRTLNRERVVAEAGVVSAGCLAEILAWVHRWIAPPPTPD